MYTVHCTIYLDDSEVSLPDERDKEDYSHESHNHKDELMEDCEDIKIEMEEIETIKSFNSEFLEVKAENEGKLNGNTSCWNSLLSYHLFGL